MNNIIHEMHETMKHFVELEDKLYNQLRKTCPEEDFDDVWNSVCLNVIDKLWFDFDNCTTDNLYDQVIKYMDKTKKWLLTCSADAIDIHYEIEILSIKEPEWWLCEKIARQHGCEYWMVEEINW